MSRVNVRKEALAIGHAGLDAKKWRFEDATVEFSISPKTGTVTLWATRPDDTKTTVDFTPNRELLLMITKAVEAAEEYAASRYAPAVNEETVELIGNPE